MYHLSYGKIKGGVGGVGGQKGAGGIKTKQKRPGLDVNENKRKSPIRTKSGRKKYALEKHKLLLVD